MYRKIFQVDVFTDVCFGGNPAGVVPEASGLSEEQMQKIAREMNLSETAFVFPLKNHEADYQVRFFTPTQEVDLCGHATIGTFYTLAAKGYIKNSNEIVRIKQQTKAGILPVELYYHRGQLERIMMTQAIPQIIHKKINISELADIMGLSIDEIGLPEHNIGPQIVSTGLPDIILPVRTRMALKRIHPNYEKLINFSNENHVIGVHAFTLEAEEKASTVACRNFAPAAGINEEAATGTSNGALGAYLVYNDILDFRSSLTIVCEQGHDMKRPSKIFVNLEGTKSQLTVKVGGKAIIVMEGMIRCQ